MSQYADNPYQSSSTYYPPFAAQAMESDRTAFIRRTYLHLAGAIALFAGVEALIFALVPPDTLARICGTMISGWNWLFVILAFMVVGRVASGWATWGGSRGLQYLGLGLYAVVEAVIFVPLLYYASRFAPNAIGSAALLTGIVFGGLTLFVFISGADFSFLRMYLGIGAMVALGVIVATVLFQWNILGVGFSALMIALASGYVVYYTSNVLHHYRTDQHVAAALALFAAVALLFWYILQLMMYLNRR